MTAPDHRLYLFATIRPKPEFFNDARAALDHLVPPTLNEPGCHIFSAFVSHTEPNTLHLFECFNDEAALESHYAKPYTKEVFQKYQTWLAKPVEILKLGSSSQASAAQLP